MEIDFVILWVDGNDVEWQREKERFVPPKEDKNIDAGSNRYRDWDNLQYWFRGVEVFAPWVRKIHFVTHGHLPKWLNTGHPKLNIVKHSDIIPMECLPTFNSLALEINIHNIKGLSENFVYLNDDTFIIRQTKETDFFKNGLPVDAAILDAIGITGLYSYLIINSIEMINKYFDKKTIIKNNRLKWLNLRYGKELYRTLALYPWESFTGIVNPHLPVAYNKNTFEEVWKAEYDKLCKTSAHRFRSKDDLCGYLMRYWRLAKGEFSPVGINSMGKYFSIFYESDCNAICDAITKQKFNMICINDDLKDVSKFEDLKVKIIDSFEKILPEKSFFEL